MKKNALLNVKTMVLTAALAFSVTACGSQAKETTVNPTSAAETTSIETTTGVSTAETKEALQEATMAETDDKAITLIDQAGREVTLDGPAESIVSSYYITTYATMALGVSDQVVGLENQTSVRPLYQMAAPELIDLPNVGTLKEFNIEAIAALEPDLVLVPMKRREDADTLADLGIVAMVVDPETQENLEGMLTLIGQACGAEERAEELVSYYHEKLEDLSELTADVEEPTVYIGGNSSYLKTAPVDMYQSDLIEIAGGDNVAGNLEGNYWVEVSYETILTMNPEVFIIPSAAKYTKGDILNDPQLADIDAVKNGQVYAMPNQLDEWDSPIPSSILGAMWMTSVLHEEQYPMETFRSEAAEFYKTFYGFDVDLELITK